MASLTFIALVMLYVLSYGPVFSYRFIDRYIFSQRGNRLLKTAYGAIIWVSAHYQWTGTWEYRSFMFCSQLWTKPHISSPL